MQIFGIKCKGEKIKNTQEERGITKHVINIGDTFGLLTALSRPYNRADRSHGSYVKCKCACGNIVEVAKDIPLDRMLVATDCPYMSPEPNRGKRNKSDYIEYIINKIAEIKEIDPYEANIQFNKNFLKYCASYA